MTVEKSYPPTLECVPDIDRVIIITGKEKTTAHAEIDRVRTKYYAFFGVYRNFLIGTEIKESAGRIIRACGYRVTARMKTYLKKVKKKKNLFQINLYFLIQ